MKDSSNQVVTLFFDEAREGARLLESYLLTEEVSTDEVFRRIHSIKGTAGYFGFQDVSDVSHSLEAVLDLVRRNRIELKSAVVNLLLEGADALRAAIDAASRNERHPVDSVTNKLNDVVVSQDPAALSLIENPRLRDLPPSVLFIPPEITRTGRVRGQRLMAVRRAVATEDRGRLFEEVRSIGTFVDCPDDDDWIRLLTVLEPDLLAIALDLPPEDVVELPLHSTTASKTTPQPPTVTHPLRTNDTSIRVPIALLDDLVNAVGELVLARNQLIASLPEDPKKRERLGLVAHHLSSVATLLRDKIMTTRLQSLDTVLQRIPRLVHDLCSHLGKEVSIEIDGGSVFLDRRVIEAVTDPLVHLVRNAVDHGIEHPDDREARGKSREGRLRISARHVGDFVLLDLEDDGSGIDRRSITQHANRTGTYTSDGSQLTDEDLVQLIFSPGFTTRNEVSSISGRGVGLDVVRTRIEGCGGSVDMDTTEGRGTRFHIRLPVSLAILPAVVASTGGVHVAVLQKQVFKIDRIETGKFHQRLVHVDGVPSLRVEQEFVPLVRLRVILGLETDRRRAIVDRRTPCEGTVSTSNQTLEADLERRSAGDRRIRRQSEGIVIIEHRDQRVGLIVDEVQDIEEVVVKPLPRHLAMSSLYAGTTILGSGDIAVILDPIGLCRKIGLTMSRPSFTRRHEDTAERSSPDQDSRTTVLIFETSTGLVGAVPLAEITAVDRFDTSEVRRIGDVPMIIRQGKPLRLVMLESLLSPSCGQPPSLPARGFLLRPSRAGTSWALVATSIRETADVEEFEAADDHEHGTISRTMVVDDSVVILPDLSLLHERIVGTSHHDGVNHEY